MVYPYSWMLYAIIFVLGKSLFVLIIYSLFCIKFIRSFFWCYFENNSLMNWLNLGNLILARNGVLSLDQSGKLVKWRFPKESCYCSVFPTSNIFLSYLEDGISHIKVTIRLVYMFSKWLKCRVYWKKGWLIVKMIRKDCMEDQPRHIGEKWVVSAVCLDLGSCKQVVADACKVKLELIMENLNIHLKESENYIIFYLESNLGIILQWIILYKQEQVCTYCRQ